MAAVEGLTSEELKKLKRDATIRAREDDYERKRQEEEENKRKQLEQLKVDYEEQEKKKLEERLATLRRRAEVRASRQAETERLNVKREAGMARREQAWLQRANSEIQEVLAEAQAEEERVEDNLIAARERKHEKESEARQQKLKVQARNEDLEMKRTEKIAERASQREVREVQRVDRLKTEAQQELQVFLQNPFPVPLKQVLAGRVRPVPRVTELLAAYKDQREALQDLEQQDIPMRALLRNQTLFQYVRDIQMKAEEERIKPPEPVIGDMGRAGGRVKRSIGSPKGKSLSPSGRTGQGWRSSSRNSKATR